MKILLTPCTFQEISVDRSNKACRLDICGGGRGGGEGAFTAFTEGGDSRFIRWRDRHSSARDYRLSNQQRGCTGSGMGARQDEKEVLGGKYDIR